MTPLLPHEAICPACGGERWRSVVGIPRYEVSSRGRVRWGDSWQLIKPSVKSSGHLNVQLYVNGKRLVRQIHRLVLEAFVGPCPDGWEAAHWNGDPADNRIENLRWATRKENFADTIRHEIVGPLNRGGQHQNAKLTEADVAVIIDELLAGCRPKDIAARYGVHPSQITRIKTGERWTHVSRPIVKRLKAATQ